jgi:hypothetical protein
MRMRNWSFILFLLLAALLPGRLTAADSSEPLLHKAIIGLLLHDRGPFSDRHESGVDPRLALDRLTRRGFRCWESVRCRERLFRRSLQS